MSRVAMAARLSAFHHIDPPIVAASEIKVQPCILGTDVDFRRS